MQYSYTQTGVLQRTVGTETYTLRTQLISVLEKNIQANVNPTTVLNDCVLWANTVSSLRGTGISYTDDVKVNFGKINAFVADTGSTTAKATFICKRIEGTSPEYLQFTLEDVTTAYLPTAFSGTLDNMSGVSNAIDKYIIVNAIIEK